MTKNVIKLGVVKTGPEVRRPMGSEEKEFAIEYLEDIMKRLKNDELCSMAMVAPMSNEKDVLFFHAAAYNGAYELLGAMSALGHQIAFDMHTGPTCLPGLYEDDDE